MTAKHTIAWWLEKAPSTISFREVADAYERFETPHEAWPSGNRRLDTYLDEEAQR